MKIYNNELKDLGKKSLEEKNKIIHERNEKAFDSFLTVHMKEAGDPGVTKEQAQFFFKLLKENPIVSLDQIQKYDPDSEVGFCFGRAAYVHLELLRHGVAPENVAKVFVIGRLQAFGSRWDFHVATITKGMGDQWWVIDNLFEDALPLKEWIQKTEKLSQDPEQPAPRVYFTDGLKFHPALGDYNEKNLSVRYYHGYFIDMMKWFKKNKPLKQNLIK